MQDRVAMHQTSAAEQTPLTGSARIARFLPLLLELALIAAIVRLFNIESHRHFFPVFCVIVSGFAIHTWLPLKYRLAFFAALSVTCVLLVLEISGGLWALGISGALIGICYLPFGFGQRTALLLVAGAALVLLRTQYPLPFWPVVGSMFMFRLISFVYDMRRDEGRPALASSISYFFLLPNACFPLFPVVDYKTFRETWYAPGQSARGQDSKGQDEDEWDIYQRGVTWICRGLAHLLLYRFLRSHVVPGIDELLDFPRVVWFMVTNYSLYLQVSGQFHLVTGLLHLFGFNLPRTHHCYFLASSCSDIWRRINIYWKDFLAKIVFFPAFFRLRQRGAPARPAMALSVILVFVVTWLLHSWQTFWLLGRFPLTINDACLWLGAGAAVAVNVLLESRRKAHRERSAWLTALGISVRTVGMFLMVSLFWACWTKPGFLHLIGELIHRPGALRGIALVLTWVLAAVLVGMILSLLANWRPTSDWALPAIDFRSSVKLHLAALGLIVAFASPRSSGFLGRELEQSLADFRANPATSQSAEQKLQSYYEDLNAASIQAGPLITSISGPDDATRVQASGFAKVSRLADKYQQLELIPGIETELDGNSFSVNQYGMRDRKSVRREKPPGVFRIALVGSSIVMGYGVSDEDVFARVFENRLNEALGNSSGRVEVLNFGVGKQWAPQRLVRIQRQVMSFSPDALFYFAHQDEFRELASHTAQLVASRLKLPSQHLKDVVDLAGVTPEMAPGAIQARLGRQEIELLGAVYRTIVDECRSRKAIPVWIYLPVPGTTVEDFAPSLIPIATNAGFIVCDLSDWAIDREGLFAGPEDLHPNAQGHERIAEALLRMVQRVPATLPPALRELSE